jgi:hypothetical protein
MVERRIFARINIKIPLKFLNSANDKEGTAETVDISANGVGFVTKENLLPETPLEMWLDIPDHHDPLHILGKVVWSQDLGNNMDKRIGVHLGEERLIGLGRVWLFKEDKPDII